MTRYYLAEQVILSLKGGKYHVSSSIEIDDVIAYMRTIMPGIVKQEWFQMANAPEGETLPQNLALSLHENIPVEPKGKRWISKLPVMPVFLPRNMGVFEIYNPDDPDCVYIPILPGLWTSFVKDKLISDAGGQIFYETYGNIVEYKVNPKVNAVSMKLVIQDISSYSDNDLLPISADHAKIAIDQAFQYFANQRPPAPISDPTTDTQFRRQ
jgi:hypothetical protein